MWLWPQRPLWSDFFKKRFILFLGCDGSLLLCMGSLQLQPVGTSLQFGTQASHCSGFSCFRAQVLGVQASRAVLLALGFLLSSCDNGFCCSAAHGIFPDQGSNQCPWYCKEDS